MTILTLNKIREQDPCTGGWKKLLRSLGKTTADDDALPLLAVLNSNGLDDALWCLRAVDGHEKEIRLFAVWCARQVQHLVTDPRSIDALDVAEQFAHGKATQAELDAARDSAWAASLAASSDAARTAASAAARAAARTASGAASAWYAASAAASSAARDAAWTAAHDAARDAQEAKLREILSKP